MRQIKTYFKGAPFYNAFLRTYPVQVAVTTQTINVAIELTATHSYVLP